MSLFAFETHYRFTGRRSPLLSDEKRMWFLLWVESSCSDLCLKVEEKLLSWNRHSPGSLSKPGATATLNTLILELILVQTSHEEAARQKVARCVPDKAPCLRRASITEEVEIPDIYLTLHGNVSLAPKMWWFLFPLSFVCCNIDKYLSERGRFSQSSKCLSVLYVGRVRTEMVRETLHPFLIQYQPQRLLGRHQWQQRDWKHRSETGSKPLWVQ